MKFSRRSFALLPASALWAAHDPANFVWYPDVISWQRADADGPRHAVLDGDRDKPGEPFTYAFGMPGGA